MIVRCSVAIFVHAVAVYIPGGAGVNRRVVVVAIDCGAIGTGGITICSIAVSVSINTWRETVSVTTVEESVTIVIKRI